MKEGTSAQDSSLRWFNAPSLHRLIKPNSCVLLCHEDFMPPSVNQVYSYFLPVFGHILWSAVPSYYPSSQTWESSPHRRDQLPPYSPSWPHLQVKGCIITISVSSSTNGNNHQRVTWRFLITNGWGWRRPSQSSDFLVRQDSTTS